jgi:glutamate synthase (ferredoxin)
VLDVDGEFRSRVNTEMVELESLNDHEEIEELRKIVMDHAHHTDSRRAWDTLAVWEEMIPQFIKVNPKDYKRMMTKIQEAKATGLNQDEAEIVAFEANMNDLARVSGS